VLKIKTWNLESGICNLEPFGFAQGSVWNPSAVIRATPGNAWNPSALLRAASGIIKF